MNFLQELLSELQQEAEVTRRFLVQVDFKDANFRPHEKSEKLGRLAVHVAELLLWWKSVLETDELNFKDFKPEKFTRTSDLLDYFDSLLAKTEQAFLSFNESELDTIWYMKHGEEVLFSLNKKEVLRKFCMNHLIHHRAQLGVYLRMLDKPIPATYGPSATDDRITLIKKFNLNDVFKNHHED